MPEEKHRHECGHVCTCAMSYEYRCLACDIRAFEREADHFLEAATQLAKSGHLVAHEAVQRVTRQVQTAIEAQAEERSP